MIETFRAYALDLVTFNEPPKTREVTARINQLQGARDIVLRMNDPPVSLAVAGIAQRTIADLVSIRSRAIRAGDDYDPGW